MRRDGLQPRSRCLSRCAANPANHAASLPATCWASLTTCCTTSRLPGSLPDGLHHQPHVCPLSAQHAPHHSQQHDDLVCNTSCTAVWRLAPEPSPRASYSVSATGPSVLFTKAGTCTLMPAAFVTCRQPLCGWPHRFTTQPRAYCVLVPAASVCCPPALLQFSTGLTSCCCML